MNRSENEQLTDVLIGEAVLYLLGGNSPITTRALVNRLRTMAAEESDNRRKLLLERVIAEICAREKATRRQKTEVKVRQRNTDNVLALFGAKNRTGPPRKH